MKIDVTQPIKEYDGTDVVEPGTKNPVPLRTFLVNALASGIPTDPDQPGPGRMTTESKERRYQLSTKLWSKKKVDLEVKERSFILECVDAAFDNPLICGRIKQVLEGEGQTVPEDASSAEATDTDPVDDAAKSGLPA